MKQLALGLALDAQLGLGDSVVGENRELYASLARMVGGPAPERIVYLWGPPGTGRTHVLRAVERTLLEAGRDVRWFSGSGDAPGQDGVLLADDVDRLADAAQVRLFGCILALAESPAALVAAGSAAPAALDLRPELRSRLASGLVYRLRPLSDPDKVLALQRHATARGFRMPEEVADYLLRHGDRDLRSLIAALDRLDRTSAEQRRPLTLPLLKEVLGDVRCSGS